MEQKEKAPENGGTESAKLEINSAKLNNLNDLPDSKKIKKVLEPQVLLAKSQIDISEDLPEPETILHINNEIFGTLGNLSLTIGKAKSMKTFLMSAAIAAVVGTKRILGFESDKNCTVLLFDTEQTRYHVLKVAKRIIKLTGLKDIPANLKVYCLRPHSTADRLRVIEYAIKNTPNLGLIIIDGIRDLIRDINSPEDATKISDWLLKMTEVYNVHILCVLHQNKGDLNARGHVGTELVNKAETVISVTKHPKVKDTSIVEAEYTRNKDFESFAFCINQEGIPELCDMPAENNERRQSLTPDSLPVDCHIKVLKLVFKTGALGYGDAWRRIKIELKTEGIKIGDNSAKEFLTYYQSIDMVKSTKNGQTKYHIVDKLLDQMSLVV